MSRQRFRPNQIADDDPVRWFHRLDRACKENDYPLAAIARDELRRLGWDVAPTSRRKSRQTAAGVTAAC
jgi:hypothetical protein